MAEERQFAIDSVATERESVGSEGLKKTVAVSDTKQTRSERQYYPKTGSLGIDS